MAAGILDHKPLASVVVSKAGDAYKWMASAFAVQDGLGCSRWLSSKPYISPYAILTAPMRLAAVKLPSALCNAAQAIDAGLDGHLAATLDGVDLLAKRI
jgi:hypothetical protein